MVRIRDDWKNDLLERFQRKEFYDKELHSQKIKEAAREKKKLISRYIEEVTGLKNESLGHAIVRFKKFYADSIQASMYEEHLAHHVCENDLLLAIKNYFSKNDNYRDQYGLPQADMEKKSVLTWTSLAWWLISTACDTFSLPFMRTSCSQNQINSK